MRVLEPISNLSWVAIYVALLSAEKTVYELVLS